MKKILIALISLVVVSMTTASAQTYDVRFDAADVYRSCVTTAADTINGTSTVSKIFKVDKSYLYYYSIQLGGVKVYDGGQNTFYVYGSMDGTKWYTLETQVWKMSTADTAFIKTASSKVAYKYIKGAMTGGNSGNRARFSNLHLQILQ